MYQNEGLLFICGDFNARCGHELDFIPGVDNVPERKILDHTHNYYGSLLCDLCTSADMAILNGRTESGVNDYTYVTDNGLSVVDYCLISYEHLAKFTNFEVYRAADVFHKASCTGVYDPSGAISDHSIICWNIEIDTNTRCSDTIANGAASTFYTKYDLSQVTEEFMNTRENELKHLFEEPVVNTQEEMDEHYKQLKDIIISEMKANGAYRKVKIRKQARQRDNRREAKPWWSEKLTHLWNNYQTAEKNLVNAKKDVKYEARKQLQLTRKLFDQEVQKAKRIFWRNEQISLLEKHKKDPAKFWKDIGKIGVGK